jgi:hypothetical protein
MFANPDESRKNFDEFIDDLFTPSQYFIRLFGFHFIHMSTSRIAVLHDSKQDLQPTPDEQIQSRNIISCPKDGRT